MSLIVKGFSGKKVLEGEIAVMGAKNFALKAQAASALFGGDVLLRNMPLIEDVFKMNDLLDSLGVEVDRVGKKSFSFKTPKNLKTDFDTDVARLFRASVVLVGPVLAREGKVTFSHPGGCVIGKRPIDVFLDAFIKMGAKLKELKTTYVLEADKLTGAEIFFKLPSVTATETIMMTAVLAKGTTKLYNCACEPEIVALAEFLNSAGANISGAGTHTIIIKGRSGRLLKNGDFKVPPDRIEAGSFAVMGALCGKNLRIKNCDISHMGAVWKAFEEAGVKVIFDKKDVCIKASAKLKALDIKTREYPGFSTDLQAPFSILLTQAAGKSLVFETVFEGRLSYLNDLKRMGANVVLCDPHRAIITGPTNLRGREMESPDLRAGLAFLIAGMIAEGESVINNTENTIDRGYEKIEERLSNIGVNIRRI